MRDPQVTAREALLYATGYSDAMRHMGEAAQEAQERGRQNIAELSRDIELLRK